MRVLDTFAGAGGFSLGFELAGCDVIGAIEIDTWASETFSFNHPKATVLTRNIETVSDEELTETFGLLKPDIVLGGPPCQGYSLCLQNSGDPTDPRNTLFSEFLQVVKVLQPSIVIMENVPNIRAAVTQSGEPVIGIIMRELKNLGYDVSCQVLSATDFGIPQIRKRMFVVGSAKRLANPFPNPTHFVASKEQNLSTPTLTPCPTLWDAISDLPGLSAGEGDEEQIFTKVPETEYQRLLRVGADKIYNHTAMRHSQRIIERFAGMAVGQSVSDVPTHLRPLKRNGNGQISPQVYDQNNRRMYHDRPCHTIPASFYANFVHPFQHRNFTPREGARLQSFPDRYVFKGKPTVVSHKLLEREGRLAEKHLCQYNQIGNAVPPLLSKAIATNILAQLTEA